MTAVSLDTLCTSVKNILETTPGLLRAQNYDELTEDYPDLPMLQVYPDEGETDTSSGDTDRTTFGAGVRDTEIVLFADFPCRQRSHLDEDMKAVVDMINAAVGVLETQKKKPYFGESGIKAFRWRWSRVNFKRGDPELTYPGVRFQITLRVF